MKLINGIIRPGIVEEVLDNGIIKASAPGLFSYNDDPNCLPSIMPWQIGSNCNSYSSPKKGDEVWILNFEDNKLQLYWFRKDTKIKKNIDTSGEHVEILCDRDIDGENASLYFTDGEGWMISKGRSFVQISADGSINISTSDPNKTISINGKGVNLGSTYAEHGAAYGDITENALFALSALLHKVALTAIPNPYTAAIGNALLYGLNDFDQHIGNIESENVFID